MQMKYVVMANEVGVESIFLFPKTIDHDAFVESAMSLRDTTLGAWRRPAQKTVAAGFVDNGKCYGRSETLNKDSRGKVDTALMSPAEY